MAQTVALSTTALTPSTTSRVSVVVDVTLRTLCLGLLPCPVTTAVSPSRVHGMGNSVEMIWANAGSVPALMIHLMPRGQGAICALVDPPCGMHRPSCSVGTTTNSEHTIAAGIDESGPDPAAIGLRWFANLGPEPLIYWDDLVKGARHWRTPPMDSTVIIAQCPCKVKRQTLPLPQARSHPLSGSRRTIRCLPQPVGGRPAQ